MVSFYDPQVVRIQEKIAHKYEKLDGFSTKIVGVKKEIDQLDDLAYGNSVLFKDAKWKVIFSNDFKTSFGNPKCSHMKKQVLNLPNSRTWNFLGVAAPKDIIQFCKPSKCEGGYEVSEGVGAVERSHVRDTDVIDDLSYLDNGSSNTTLCLENHTYIQGSSTLVSFQGLFCDLEPIDWMSTASV
uniref:UvrD-like helicase, ATP-binding domain, P-loop containing nucleoside triphosphate hydrolase n=1 Tax=Tanacetum cinerariifolium TaxID=118510 RepID=A0A6L2JUZ9_TANCI|nr:UvrD-like helicase, ATP-binding domain, P-loop containing nucleoside triphosphate hydrolase [Tanacetum cinerariifolium]